MCATAAHLVEDVLPERSLRQWVLNPHLHSVFLDGAYHEAKGELVWREPGHLKTSEVGEVLEHAVPRMVTPPAGPRWTYGGRASRRRSRARWWTRSKSAPTESIPRARGLSRMG